MVGVYKIISPSSKVYIGQSIDIERRFKKYRLGNISKIQPKLFNSFFKHGVLNHTFTVIEECNIEDLTLREEFWIEFYDATSNKGLNIRKAGSKGAVAESTKEKISKALKGRKITWADKVAQKTRGQKRSKELKELLSNIREQWWREKYREIYDNAEYIIKEYNSGVSKSKLMSKYNIGYDTLNKVLSYL